MKIPVGKIARWLLATLVTAAAQVAVKRLSKPAPQASIGGAEAQAVVDGMRTNALTIADEALRAEADKITPKASSEEVSHGG